MTTKKQLRTMLEEEKTEKAIALEGLADAVKQNTESEKLTNHLRETIRSLTEKLEDAESEINDLQSELYGAEKEVNRQRLVINDLHIETDCTRCEFADHHRPQKCQACRRGAKDLYTPTVPTNS